MPILASLFQVLCSQVKPQSDLTGFAPDSAGMCLMLASAAACEFSSWGHTLQLKPGKEEARTLIHVRGASCPFPRLLSACEPTSLGDDHDATARHYGRP